MQPLVDEINDLEPEIQALSDEQLAAKTDEFKSRIAGFLDEGFELDEILDDLLPEAFAVAREAGTRTLGMRAYDVQLVGGIVLHRGRIAEMKTGEGKTLVATLPMYLNALAGKGCHLVTVNDYLAYRDAEWMGKLFRFLGLSVGVITHGKTNAERKQAYDADITYGTNNEFGFDYLRDNMKYDLADYVQRDHFFAIVDEVDSILIDEARTPLIISGPTDDNPALYKDIDRVVRDLIATEKKLGTDPRQDPEEGENPGVHYHIDLEHKSVVLTEDGISLAEQLTGIDNLYAPDEVETLHHVQQALRAHTLYTRDVEYVVQNGEVVIVDEFTGRMMPGRRWSDGLHQAVEAKEGVAIESENQTLATITYQNYFKMYNKLAGMTGTADTEAGEFHSIYDLEVTVIPTNKPIAREDEADLVFKRETVKFKEIAEKIKELHDKNAPVLVGTTSVEKSERIEKALVRQGVHKKMINVLNAKQHGREAEIVAQAGRSGAITIATNMAGRGTDIVLGGNPEHFAWGLLNDAGIDREELIGDQFIKLLMMGQTDRAREVAADDERITEDMIEQILEHRQECLANQKIVLEAGGLHIIGTERHESRRVDNQLRGRSGRQGDPGWSQFYLSLEDDLIHVFGGDRILNLMDRLGMEEDEAIQHPWLSKSIASAQEKVEGRNFEIRKNLLDYDDVMNQQRTVVYTERRRILGGEGLDELYEQIVEDMTWDIVDMYVSPKTYPDDWDWKGIGETMHEHGVVMDEPSEDERASWKDEDLQVFLKSLVIDKLTGKQQKYGDEAIQFVLKQIMLMTLDHLWKEHLLAMDHLREGIGLRGYGQKDPKREYAREGFELFQQMLVLFRQDVVRKVSLVEMRSPEEQKRAEEMIERMRQQAEAAKLVSNENREQSSYGVGSAIAAAGAAIPTQSAAGAAGIAAAVPPPNMQAPPQAFPGDSGATVVRDNPKVGRNDPCPCGSGKKYKKCHYPEYD